MNENPPARVQYSTTPALKTKNPLRSKKRGRSIFSVRIRRCLAAAFGSSPYSLSSGRLDWPPRNWTAVLPPATTAVIITTSSSILRLLNSEMGPRSLKMLRVLITNYSSGEIGAVCIFLWLNAMFSELYGNVGSLPFMRTSASWSHSGKKKMFAGVNWHFLFANFG